MSAQSDLWVRAWKSRLATWEEEWRALTDLLDSLRAELQNAKEKKDDFWEMAIGRSITAVERRLGHLAETVGEESVRILEDVTGQPLSGVPANLPPIPIRKEVSSL